MKSIYETLAALGAGAAYRCAPLAGAVLLTGCGGSPAPVNASEVPAATDAKPMAAATAAAMVENKSPDAAAAAANVNAAPTAAPTASATAGVKPAAPAGSVKPGAAPKKVTGVKKKDQGGTGTCGEGTCG